MFYYLSFLRPPPSRWSTQSKKPLTVTPQITNDLRTEFYPEVADIYFAWVKCDTRGGVGSLSQPAKLTTWREANAYKEVPVPPPRAVQQGQSWQLLLSCSPPSGNLESSNLLIDLSEPSSSFGRNPLPVLSLPISFGPALIERRGEPKQKNIERLFKFPELVVRNSGEEAGENAKIGLLRLFEHLSFDLDKKIWDSGVGLSKWLLQQVSEWSPPAEPDTLATSTTSESFLDVLLEGPSRKIVLELGAGTGLVSIVLAALLRNVVLYQVHEAQRPALTIYASDLPSAMEVIEQNVELNSPYLKDLEPIPLVLDWENDYLPQEIYEGVNLIVMADVTYNTSSFPALTRTLQKLISLNDDREGRHRAPMVLLAYKQRHPDERSLWSMIKAIGLTFREVARIEGAGKAPIEIYLGKFDIHSKVA